MEINTYDEALMSAKTTVKIDVDRMNFRATFIRRALRTDCFCSVRFGRKGSARRTVNALNLRLDSELERLEQFKGKEDIVLYQTELTYIQNEIEVLLIELADALEQGELYRFLQKLEIFKNSGEE